MTLNHVGDCFLKYFTPYEGLCHLYTPKDDGDRTLLKVSSVAIGILSLGILTLASHLYCRIFFKDHSLVLRSTTTPTVQVARARLHGVALDTRRLEVLQSEKLEDVIAIGMEYFLVVSPYKPCGYTEFMFSALAQGEKARPRAEYTERLTTLKREIPLYALSHSFDNYISEKDFPESEGLDKEFWSCHPPSIMALCRENKEKITAGRDKSPHVLELVEQLKARVEAEDELGVAQTFVELAKIHSSLPQAWFYAAFGDVRALVSNDTETGFGDGDTFISVGKDSPLFHIYELKQAFPTHSEHTVRNLCSYFYHQKDANPIESARKILRTLDPKFHYIIKEHTLYKKPPFHHGGP